MQGAAKYGGLVMVHSENDSMVAEATQALVAQGKTGRVLLTKHNRPIAAIVPVEHELAELWGAMRGTVKVAPGVDLTQGADEVWEAEA